MFAPRIHWTAHYRVFDPALPKVRGDRQAKRACANDKDVTDGHEAVPFPRHVRTVIAWQLSVDVRSLAEIIEAMQKLTGKRLHDKKLSKWIAAPIVN